MEEIIVEGKTYYSAQDVAVLWGLSKKTIERYAAPSSGKIRGCVRSEGKLLVPTDAIRPITEPVAQGIIWGILFIKNDPSSYLDLTEFGIANNQLGAVLDDLERQLYVDSVKEYEDERDRLLKLRLTDKAIKLVQYRRKYKDNPLKGKLTANRLQVVFSAVQTIAQVGSNFG